MGHALLVVIVEPEIPVDAIERRVAELMDPYGPDLDIEEQDFLEFPCFCTNDGSQDPDPDCQTCEGSGEVLEAFNSQQTWDWYRFGGHWAGEMQGDATVQDPPREDDPTRHMTLVREIPAQLEACAILTPDGEWHGGDAVEDPDPLTWASERATLLQRYPDHLAIAVDFHY